MRIGVQWSLTCFELLRSCWSHGRTTHAKLDPAPEAFLGEHYVRPLQGCPLATNANPAHHGRVHPSFRRPFGRPFCFFWPSGPLRSTIAGRRPWRSTITVEHCRTGGQKSTLDARPVQGRFSPGFDHATFDARPCLFCSSNKSALQVGNVTCDH